MQKAEYMVEGERLLVPLSGGLDEENLEFMLESLPRVVISRRIRGVIFDFSPLSFMDSHGACRLQELAKTVSLLGAEPVFCGIGPGVAASLAEINVTFKGIRIVSDHAEAHLVLDEMR